MSGFWTAIAQFLLSQGVFGLVSLLLLGAVYLLWKKLETKDERIRELEDELRTQSKECNEQSLSIQERVFSQQGQVTEMVNRLGDALETMRDVLLRGKR